MTCNSHFGSFSIVVIGRMISLARHIIRRVIPEIQCKMTTAARFCTACRHNFVKPSGRKVTVAMMMMMMMMMMT
jgi:hypothetical protein